MTRALPERSDGALRRDADASMPAYRYFAVLGLTLGGVVFLIAAPTADWSRAVAVAIQGLALVVTIGTSRERETVRRHRALVVGLGMFAFVLLIALGVVARWMTPVVAVIVTAAVPVALVKGLLRL